LYAETQYPAAAGWHPLAALVDGSMKVITAGTAELYDESSDPRETHDVSPAHAALVDALRRRIGALTHVSSVAPAGPAAAAADRLRALGYVSGGAARVSDSAPNPARHIAAWNSFENELAKLAAGDAGGAAPGLTLLARAYPDALVFQSTYARALK